MQIKNKQLAGFRTLTSSYVMQHSEDLLVSADGVSIVLPSALDGDFFTTLVDGTWTGTTLYVPPTGFTVQGATSLQLSNSIKECKFVLKGTDWTAHYLADESSVTNEPTGFEDISSTIGFGTLIGYDPAYEFDSTATTFTITPIGAQSIWVMGKNFIKTDPESIEVNADGLSFIYYDANGVLSVQSTFFNLGTQAPVSYVYRHDGKILFMGDERHGVTMDWATHDYLHHTRGAAYASGFGVNGYTLTGDGTQESDLTINLASGEFYDEDLLINIQHSLTGGYFAQPLETPAELPVFYHDATGWAAVKATDVPAIIGTTRMAYNKKVVDTWSLDDVQNNHFGIMFVIATNNLLAPVIAVMGQNTYGSKGAAEAELYSDIDLDGFPFYEFRPLYKLIYEVKDSYTNSVKAALRGVMDLRTVSSSGVGTSAAQVNDHGSLTGLLDDDHPQYLNEVRADLRYLQQTFETVSKNLKSFDNTRTYTAGGLPDTITYSNGVVKTFSWDPSGRLTSVVLSGTTPSGIELTKTFTYDAAGNITSIVYS